MVKNLADRVPHTSSLARSPRNETKSVELADPASVIGAIENAIGTRRCEVSPYGYGDVAA